MADKQTASLIIKANLECEKCYKKIQKVLRKLKEKEKITKIDYENQNNKVTVTGHFKQEELAHKLRCKACEAIKDIEFVPIKKPEEKKPEVKKPEEKKPEVKKPDEKKPEEKKTDDGKKEEKKPAAGEEKKSEKPKEAEAKPAAAPAPEPSTTVNLQFTNMCGICYPWPCSDPTHWAGGGVHPQWPSCESTAAPPPALPAFPGHHHHHQNTPWGGVVPAAPPKWPCGGPSYCGGCGTCRGRGWPAMPPAAAMCCPGASSCRGCKGCRIVQEGKFVYEEYPASACAIM